MANDNLGAESARENPHAAWQSAVDRLAMARGDALEDVETDEEIMLLGGAQCEATYALLLTPAPNAEALAHKIAVFREEEVYRLDNIGDFFDALIADVRRLGREARHGRA